MVERIILFKLHEPSARSELAAATEAALSQLTDIDELSVGLPADAASEKSWDLSVVLGVSNLLLLDRLLESAPIKTWLEQTMGPRSAVIKAWSFERALRSG